MVELRDMTERDIEDYVRWFTTETEWMKTDAPWEFEGSGWNCRVSSAETPGSAGSFNRRSFR
ncbi:MAG: hypothetical protein J6Y10_06625 [Lachnospiraceae bacterium]|nr:hypothetical protein [Lachnospiraceae bacterium]